MKQVLLIIGTLMVFNSYADQLNESTEIIKNNPTVNSKLYSGALFPEQNKITSYNGNYGNSKESNTQNLSYYNKNNVGNSNYSNSPTVNSKLYSGAQFPEQNEITNNKAKYNSTKNLNNPTVNSKLYSGAQFPEQNNF